MTARATFPPAMPRPVPVRPVPERTAQVPPDTPCAEARLTSTALRLWQGGAAARTDAAAHLRAAFGDGPGDAIVVALDRVCAAAQDDTDPDTLARLVAATLQGTDAEDAARHMALGLVPAHRMEPLVISARGLALALRRAVLIVSGPAHCPGHAPTQRR